MEDDRLSRDKLINKQARSRGDVAKAGGNGNRWHKGMVEKHHQDKERKGRHMRGKDIK
jgi:hypothetical protein